MKRLALILVISTIALSYVVAQNRQTVTYTITSKTSVAADGVVPQGSTATFKQSSTTGKNGQMTAGNSTTFTLSGLYNVRLYSITLQMHSNTSSGAGSLEMRVGDRRIATVEDSPFAYWYGEYTTANVPLTWDYDAGYTFLPVSAGGDGTMLEIYIKASQNSLYISSYTFTYDVMPATPYSVNFHTGTATEISPLTESVPAAGVILPECADVAPDWLFIGWIQMPVYELNNAAELPEIYQAGEIFYPIEPTTLYALYTNEKESDKWAQDTLYVSGKYIIANGTWKAMANSAVNKDDKLYTIPLRLEQKNADSLYLFPFYEYPESAVYYIDFLPDSTATIQHVQTNSFIGAPTALNGKLTTDKTPWCYHVNLHHEVIFYQSFANDEWMQFVARCGTQLNTIDSVWYQTYKTTNTNKGNVLFCIDNRPEIKDIVYTSFPLGSAINNTFNADICITNTAIHNPHAFPLTLYTITGVPVLYTHTDIHFRTLQTGVYILHANHRSRKIIVP